MYHRKSDVNHVLHNQMFVLYEHMIHCYNVNVEEINENKIIQTVFYFHLLMFIKINMGGHIRF